MSELDSSLAFSGVEQSRLPAGTQLYRGKVRDVLTSPSAMILVTTDRISAFDQVLGVLPGKGEILNQMSLHWFHETSDIVQNHIQKELSPRSVQVRQAKVLPVEVIVRGYLTGSAWRDWRSGVVTPGLEDLGHASGWKAHQKLPEPRVTPSTKAEAGAHDEPISHEHIIRQGLVEEGLWKKVVETALKLYERGRRRLAERGLILVDTKYEFGLVDGQLTLVDEVHTPDCSRFWYLEDYDAAFREGREPKKLDKEYFRAWLLSQGYKGYGPAPAIPESVWEGTLSRYREAFHLITGREWQPSQRTAEAETQLLLSSL